MMLILMLITMFKFCVKESSNLIGLKNLGLQGFSLQLGWVSAPPVSQKVTKSPPTPPTSLSPPNFYIIITWNWRLKNKNKKHGYINFQQQNKSIFQGNLYKIFCLWCTFLQKLVIHGHEGLVQAQKC